MGAFHQQQRLWLAISFFADVQDSQHNQGQVSASEVHTLLPACACMAVPVPPHKLGGSMAWWLLAGLVTWWLGG